MKTIEILYDVDRTRAVYKKYFDFEKNRQFQKIPYSTVFLIGIGFVSIGLFTKIDFYLSLGVLMILGLELIRLYYKFRFDKSYRFFLDSLAQMKNTTELSHLWGFDMEKMIHESEISKHEIKWMAIKRFNVNEEDIYTYMLAILNFTILFPNLLLERNYLKNLRNY